MLKLTFTHPLEGNDMSTFDPTNAGQGGNRERPEPGDPEAQFYPPPGASNDQEQDRQNYTGYGYGPGYRPDMDPDGFARQQGAGKAGRAGSPGLVVASTIADATSPSGASCSRLCWW